jgi:hypothetical protein
LNFDKDMSNLIITTNEFEYMDKIIFKLKKWYFDIKTNMMILILYEILKNIRLYNIKVWKEINVTFWFIKNDFRRENRDTELKEIVGWVAY